jgi:glycosyltransferase involved in cell wall biosynthesis
VQGKNKAILFIVQYPKRVSPAQRFRFELYEGFLQQNGFDVTTRYFLNKKEYEIIHKDGFFLRKSFAVIRGFLRRTKLLFSILKYDYVLLQREAAPLGPPIFEWVIIKIFKRKIIYDFDDAIWIPHISQHNRVARYFKNTAKVKYICKWAYKVSCGNEYLCSYARQYSNRVIYNPTCVDTDNQHNMVAEHNAAKLTIGWTGSFSTLKYLDALQPILKKLQGKYDFDIKIICNKRPELDLENIIYIEWSEENEIKELASCQIGLMLLPDDEWSKGKCGFKLIQYMALEIPALCSPIGVNNTIIDNGLNGVFCDSPEEWYTAIERLLLDDSLRKRMGEAGRKKIMEQYSLQSNKENILSLFN